MIEIPLTHGMISLIDDEDYDLVSQYRWYAQKDHNTFYARTSIYLGRQNGKQLFRRLNMHRLILNAAPGQKVDHHDLNGLNNHRHNLRFATVAQNGQNSRVPVNSTTGFKGVAFAKREGRFQASLECNGRIIWLGYHDTAEAAARAYNVGALTHFGEFARLNVIP